VVVNEHEQRRVLDGTPVPDGAYLALAQATEYVSNVKPDFTGGSHFVAAEAVTYYILAGSFDAAIRLASKTMSLVAENRALSDYLAELIDEAATGLMENGNRTQDPLAPISTSRSKGLEGMNDSDTYQALSLKLVKEVREIREFEEVASALPSPEEPIVDVFVGPYDSAPDPEIEIARGGVREVLISDSVPNANRKDDKAAPVKDSGKKLTRYERQFGLTPLQIKTLDAYIEQGMPSSAELARYLGITRNAVSVRFSFILSDLGVSGRSEAVKYLLAARKKAEGSLS